MKTLTSYSGTATATGDIQRIIGNSLADNLTWGLEMVNDSIRYLVAKYYFNERSYTTVTVAQQQFYNLPPQIKKLINVTVTIGSVLWQPVECTSKARWDYLNTIQFYQDFPSEFFVYNGQVGIWPNPSSSGNTITMNYKIRTVDLSMADVTDVTSSQTVAITTNTTTVTASGATFKAWMAGQWIRVNRSSTDSANGDFQWYQIDTITSSTILVLKNKYTGATVTGAGFIIGEVPILPEDYQDLPLYRMGLIYYTTRFPDPTRADQYQKLWDAGEAKLNEEFGSKTTSVVLQDREVAMLNPNLYQTNVS